MSSSYNNNGGYLPDTRPVIVGGDGADYDQLLSVGADPPPPQPHYGQGYGAPPPPVYQGGFPSYYPAPPPPANYQSPPMAMPVPPGVYHRPPDRHIAHEPIARKRDFPVGFTRAGIVPGDPVEIEVKPQVLFKGKRLAVAPSIAKDFMIVDIKVGKNSQLAATGEMPAESFSALAVGTLMELDTASPGITITMRVRNTSTLPLDFKAVLYGAVME